MFGEFRIIAVIDSGEVKTYLARHPAFTRTIMLHVLPKHEASGQGSLTGCLDRISPEGRERLLDRGKVDGSEYVATAVESEFRNFRAWLAKMEPGQPGTNAAPPRAPESTKPPQPPAATPAGDFTRLFHAAPAAEERPDLPEPAPAPGEFTRLFGGVVTPQGSESKPQSQGPAPSTAKSD